MSTRKSAPETMRPQKRVLAQLVGAAMGPTLDTLTRTFLLRTQKDVDRLNTLIACAVKGNITGLKESRRICHSIHGAGAMFGYPLLSGSAGRMERLVNDMLHDIQETPLVAGAAPFLLIECMNELASALEAAGRVSPAENCLFRERPRRT